MHSILSSLSCLSLSCRTLSYPSELFLQYLRSYIFCSNQMVNTRRTGSDQQQGQNNQGTGIPMPPPLSPEQYFQLQMQMMATLNNTIQALQQAHTQPPPPPPPQTHDRRAEFLRAHPPTFSHMSDPIQADDWLRAVERQLDIA